MVGDNFSKTVDNKVVGAAQRWGNSVLITEYEYEYYSVSQKWPNTNTNIIWFPKNDWIRIRIFFVFPKPKMTEYEYKYRVFFLTGPPDFNYQRKSSCSQPGLLFQEIFNVKKLLVGWASFFHFGTENRADQLKKTPCKRDWQKTCAVVCGGVKVKFETRSV